MGKKDKQKTRYLISTTESGPWKNSGSMARSRTDAHAQFERPGVKTVFMRIEHPDGSVQRYRMDEPEGLWKGVV
jgi:hypothetical protein